MEDYISNSKFINDSESNRFGYISIILLVVGCLGGVAVSLGAMQSIVALSLIVFPTMGTLTALLAVAPFKWIYSLGAISCILDLAVIFYYLLL